MSALPLVLVHGFMGGSSQWRLLEAQLGSRYRIVTIDLPGYGENNTLQPCHSIGEFAQFVLDHLTDLGIEQFHLLGHSMGGMIVQEMAALAPARVARLIIYGSASAGDLPGRFESFETSKQRITRDGVQASARRICATWFRDYEQATEFEHCAVLAEKSSLAAMLSSLDAMKAWSRSDSLAHIACPTLIIWGELDRTYRWDQVNKLWGTIPDAHLAVIPYCAHAAHLEAPEIFGALVIASAQQSSSL